MSAERNEQLVRDFFNTLSTGELEKVRPLLHKDATWSAMAEAIPGSGDHKGRDVIIDDFLAPVRGLFEDGDPKIEIRTVIGKGDLVAAETVGRGTLRNGKVYHNRYCWMIECRDGLIYWLREYMDSHHVMGLVGD
jgi:ketosteroid isomerase-like protein